MEQYLQQILDELRAIRRLLEQGGVSGQASSAEVADQLPLFTTAALDLSVQPADSAKDYLVVDHSVFVGYHLSVTLCTEEPYHGQTKTLCRPTER